MNHITRVSLVSLGLAVAATSSATSVAHADQPVEFRETVVHDTTTHVEIALDHNTVICSAADYGALFLKILIPELANLTLLDHQNTGAGAPCVAAGWCQAGNMPEDIIEPGNPTEVVEINVKAVRAEHIDHAANTCEVSLSEQVTVDIRGTEFVHERGMALGSRPYSDCLVTTAPAPVDPVGGDDKSDYGGTPDPAPEAGGCSTAPATSSALLVTILGGVFVRRRRAR